VVLKAQSFAVYQSTQLEVLRQLGQRGNLAFYAGPNSFVQDIVARTQGVRRPVSLGIGQLTTHDPHDARAYPGREMMALMLVSVSHMARTTVESAVLDRLRQRDCSLYAGLYTRPTSPIRAVTAQALRNVRRPIREAMRQLVPRPKSSI